MKNPVSKAVQSAVYLISGILFGFGAFGSLTILQSRNAPVSPFKYVAFFSSVALVIAAGVALCSEKRGRTLALLSMIGLGTIYVPRAAAVVLQHGTPVSPLGCMLYFLILGFALFFPNRRNQFGNRASKHQQ
jgi:hypothetical protein